MAFDSYWSSPTSDGTEESVMYRFGSVGQVICALTPFFPKQKHAKPEWKNKKKEIKEQMLLHLLSV